MARPRYRAAGTHQAFLATSAARTTTGNSAGVAANEKGQVAKLDVNARSGTTPQLTVTIDESPNGSTGWVTRHTFAVMTNTGSQVMQLPRVGPFARASWTISGTTPSFTFSVQVANDASTLQ
jgi:hypothetical protein